MKKTIFVIFISLILGVALNAQTTMTKPAPAATPPAEKMKKPTFRATKDQIMQVQKMLKSTETGKMDGEFRAAVNARYTIS